MKKIYIYIVIFIFALAATQVFAEPLLSWKRIWDSGHNDYTPHVVMDKYGNTYVASSFNNVFEPGHQADMRLMKYDSQGNILWNRTYDGGGGSDYSKGILLSDSGDVYLYGESFNSKDSLWDLRTIKYSGKGEVIWNVQDDAKKNTVAIGMDIAKNGNLYLFGLQTVFDKKVMRLKSYDSAGKELWEKDYDISFKPTAIQANKNRIYITGSRYNPQKSGWDIVLFTIDTAGKVMGDKIVYNKGIDNKPAAIIQDDRGDIYIAATSGNPEGSDRHYKIVLLKYKDSGELIWEGSYDSKLDDVALGATLGGDGSVYITGNTDGDLLLVKFDKDGNVLWDVIYDGGTNNVGTGVAVNNNTDVVVCGVTITPSTKSPDIITLRYRQ